jgi:long-subunit fatty acid transport protein
VALTPTELATKSAGAGSNNCGAYVMATAGTSSGFSIGVTSAIPDGTTVGFFYRVIQL